MHFLTEPCNNSGRCPYPPLPRIMGRSHFCWQRHDKERGSAAEGEERSQSSGGHAVWQGRQSTSNNRKSVFYDLHFCDTNLLSLSLQSSWPHTLLPVGMTFFREISKRELSVMPSLGWSREKGVAAGGKVKVPERQRPEPEATKGKHFQGCARNVGRTWEPGVRTKQLTKAQGGEVSYAGLHS